MIASLQFGGGDVADVRLAVRWLRDAAQDGDAGGMREAGPQDVPGVEGSAVCSLGRPLGHQGAWTRIYDIVSGKRAVTAETDLPNLCIRGGHEVQSE